MYNVVVVVIVVVEINFNSIQYESPLNFNWQTVRLTDISNDDNNVYKGLVYFRIDHVCRLCGATVARLTPDQKVACSNHVRVSFCRLLCLQNSLTPVEIKETMHSFP